MESTEYFLVAFSEIEIHPNLTKDQLKHVIESQLRDLMERYRTKRLRESNSK